ncbi:glycosyltransferase family 4 protein [uncultured Sphingomonas sp.]|uniref:glycosyltransferase family 4 protein n=1 Tax=uncultured Sphingomonas sp. TaxID=158754 RepID=UPI0035CC7104
MKVAIVHDWFTARGGAELCVEQFLHLYPQADLFSLVDFLPEEQRALLGGRKVHTSFIQKLPFVRKHYRSYLALMPLAVEQFDLSSYDLVISTSSAVAKGVITGPDQVHVSYVFSPIRYAWDLQHQYLRESGTTTGPKSWIARLILHYIRLWDVRTAPGVDHFIGISHFIARRIRKTYGRDAAVIYPPVDIDRFTISARPRQDYYVTSSRMVPYKHIPTIVSAFAAMPDRELIVIGDGPDMDKVRKCAGSNVTIMGRQPDEVLVDKLQHAKAFLFAAEEDFGIAPLEAQACGTPVVAFGKGAALETISDGRQYPPTGIFFDAQTPEAIGKAVERLDAVLDTISPAQCRANAERFSVQRFQDEAKKYFSNILRDSEFHFDDRSGVDNVAGQVTIRDDVPVEAVPAFSTG